MATAVARRVPPQRLIDLVNPGVRALLSSPLHRPLDPSLLVLHVTGRRTGRRYDIPVGYVDVDGRLLVVTQHRWRTNLRGGADVEVTLRGHRLPMRAEVDEDPASVAVTFRGVIDRFGARAARRLLGLRYDPDRPPTATELERVVRESGLGVVVLGAR